MATTAALTENSRQGINRKIPPCIGHEARLSRDLRPGCGHAYHETPVGLVVYVRNDPVNAIDPDGRALVYINDFLWWDDDGVSKARRDYEGEIDPSGFDDYIDSPFDGGGGPDPMQVRMDFLKGVLGESNKNILDRVVGECAFLIDAMIRQLQPSYAYPSAKDFVSWQLNTAIQWNYFGVNDKTGIGLHAGGWAYAFTENNTVYLGELFFSGQKKTKS